MSERCRCGQPSKGSVGQVRFCVRCFAALIGVPAKDRRLRDRLLIDLHDSGAHLSVTEWVPDLVLYTRQRRGAH